MTYFNRKPKFRWLVWTSIHEISNECVAVIGLLFMLMYVSRPPQQRNRSLAFSLSSSRHHGWESRHSHDLPVHFTHRRGEADFSDIPVVDAKENIDDVSWMHRPFIVRGDRDLLARQAVLGRDQLLEAADRLNLSTQVGYSWTITKNGGEGPQTMPLSQFLTHSMYEKWYDGDVQLEPPYAFDRDLKISGLPEKVPRQVRSWKEKTFQIPETASRIAMLGAPGSAVGWHQHGAAVQMTIHGWKRWFLYPRGRYPPGDGPGGGDSITDWLRIVYPKLSQAQAPLECIQRPGDMIYVPDGWYHAVLNLADAVAVSFQSHAVLPELQDRFKGVSLQYIEHLRRNDPAAIDSMIRDAEEYVQQHPENNLHARKVLFYCLMESHPHRAIAVMLEATSLDPFHVPMHFELAKFLEERSSAGDEQALQIFEDAMRAWEPYLESQPRNLKALWILSKFYKLKGDDEKRTQYHMRLVDLHERGIDR